MRLILTPWKNLLFERARAAKKSVTLISPFIKSNIVNGLLSEISDAAISVKAVTRHKAIEFAAGVSDIDAAYSLSGFAFESPRNFEVRFHDQLHAKIFIFDDEVAYVGSSNLTFSELQRNYEAVVEIVDADSIVEICKEVELYWVRAQPITKSGFTELFSAVQAYSREKKVVAEDEHFYQITDGSPGQPSEPTTDDANFTAAEIAPPIVSSVEEPARITESAKSSVEISPAEDKSTSIDFEATFLPTIDNFLQMVSNRFNLNPHDNLSLYVATIFQVDALNVLQRTKLAERAPYLSDLVDSKTVLSLIAVGKAVFELCISQIAIRAGIMRRYGPPAVSLLIGVISQKRMLATLWHQNFLGPLISLPPADIGKSAFTDACFRLFAAVSETHGFETCSAIIERFWNPLDLLGTDVISVLAYKDPKTELQEIVQAASGRFTYSEYENLGSEHITDWSCTLGVGSIVVKGRGDSKGLAEADAASRALAMMYRMPRWQKVIEERRATQISLLRKRGPWLMRPKVDLSVSTRARIREAYQTRLNWNIDPELGFLAQIDRTTAIQRRFHFDSSALAIFGAHVLVWIIDSFAFKRGIRDVGKIANLQRTILLNVSKAFELDALRLTLGFPVLANHQQKLNCSQAMVGALFWGSSNQDFVSTISPAIELLISEAAESDSVKTLSGGGGLERLDEAFGSFDPAVQYTQIVQEIVQSIDVRLPEYKFVKSGSDDSPTFRSLSRWREFSAAGTGSSKKAARNRAAFELLAKLVEAKRTGVFPELSQTQ